MVTLREILRGRDEVIHRTGREASRLDVAPAVHYALMTEGVNVGNLRVPGLFPGSPYPALADDYVQTAVRGSPLFGLRVTVKDYLPRGIWRLTDEHGGLLHDPRSGRTLRECMAYGAEP